MKLNLLERVTLISILPAEANFVDLRIVNELKQVCSFSEADMKKYEITIDEENDRINWDPDRAEDLKDIDVGPRALEIITKALTKLNDEEKLTDQHFTLYEKFVVKLKIT